MSGVLILVELAGDLVLLLWGLRLVQSGIERAYGSDLRRLLGRALRYRLVALAAGAGVTMLLQSSTATALMVTNFAARGTMELLPALAVMLGANIGTALIVKALSFDVSWLSPLLLVAGYVAFRYSPKGRRRDLGRVGIGLGLMLAGLHMMAETLQPSGGSLMSGRLISELANDSLLRRLLASLTADPVVDVLIGTVFSLVAHSSIAVLLVLVGIAGSHILTPLAAIALVLGANLGGAIPPVLETSGANRRVPAGNLAFRVVGCALVLPFLRPIAELLWRHSTDPRSALTSFHLAFNCGLALLFIFCLGPVQTWLQTLFPDKVMDMPEVPVPQFLDEDALATPYLALSNAAREILRMGDLVETLLRQLALELTSRHGADTALAARLGTELDLLHEAVKSYLGRLDRAALTDRDSVRLSDLIEFAVNVGQSGDIIERQIRLLAAHDGAVASEADRPALLAIQTRVAADLRLALSTMMTEDSRSAEELREAKRVVNDAERAAARDHLARLANADPQMLAASKLFLALLRDLRLVNSHLASIGYAVLEPRAVAGWS